MSRVLELMGFIENFDNVIWKWRFLVDSYDTSVLLPVEYEAVGLISI